MQRHIYDFGQYVNEMAREVSKDSFQKSIGQIKSYTPIFELIGSGKFVEAYNAIFDMAKTETPKKDNKGKATGKFDTVHQSHDEFNNLLNNILTVAASKGEGVKGFISNFISEYERWKDNYNELSNVKDIQKEFNETDVKAVTPAIENLASLSSNATDPETQKGFEMTLYDLNQEKGDKFLTTKYVLVQRVKDHKAEDQFLAFTKWVKNSNNYKNLESWNKDMLEAILELNKINVHVIATGVSGKRLETSKTTTTSKPKKVKSEGETTEIDDSDYSDSGRTETINNLLKEIGVTNEFPQITSEEVHAENSKIYLNDEFRKVTPNETVNKLCVAETDTPYKGSDGKSFSYYISKSYIFDQLVKLRNEGKTSDDYEKEYADYILIGKAHKEEHGSTKELSRFISNEEMMVIFMKKYPEISIEYKSEPCIYCPTCGRIIVAKGAGIPSNQTISLGQNTAGKGGAKQRSIYCGAECSKNHNHITESLSLVIDDLYEYYFGDSEELEYI